MGLYFSELQGKPVFDAKGKKVGLLKDMVFLDGEKEAAITHLVLPQGKLPTRFVDLVGKRIELNTTEDQLVYEPLRDDDFTVHGYILDKQIVDVDGLKVVRVNDIYLDRSGDSLVIHSVDIGTRGILRRLGLQQDIAKNILGKKQKKAIKGRLISWEYVQPLHSNLSRLALKVPKIRMENLHPADIADIMEDLSARERVVVLRSLDDRKAAETLSEAHPEVQRSLLRYMRLETIISLFETMRVEQAAHLLQILSPQRREHILSLVKKARATEIKEFMGYAPNTVGAIMQTDMLAIPEDYTMTKTLNLLRKVAPSPSKVYYLYVVDKARRLVGILSLRLLLITAPRKTVGEVMRKNTINVNVNTLKEDVAKLMIKYNLVVVPVVDDDQRIKGVVTAYEVLSEVTPKSWKLNTFFPTKEMGKIR
ncbi:MAG: CBS domain-containing protein [Nanoarchaeota archaeon]